MVVVGLLLLIVGGVALVDIALSSDGTTSLHVLGWHLGQAGPGVMLLIGVGIGVVLVLGLVSVLSGQRRSVRKNRRQRRALAGKDEENRRLTEQLRAQQKAEAAHEPTVRTVPSTVPTGVVQPDPPDPYPTEPPPVGFVPADRASEDDRDTTSAEQAAPAKATRGRKR